MPLVQSCALCCRSCPLNLTLPELLPSFCTVYALARVAAKLCMNSAPGKFLVRPILRTLCIGDENSPHLMSINVVVRQVLFSIVTVWIVPTYCPILNKGSVHALLQKRRFLWCQTRHAGQCSQTTPCAARATCCSRGHRYCFFAPVSRRCDLKRAGRGTRISPFHITGLRFCC
jgi:hypothetical protein